MGLCGRSGHRRLLGAEAALEVRKVLERVLEEALVDAEVEHVERVVLLERADGPLEAVEVGAHVGEERVAALPLLGRALALGGETWCSARSRCASSSCSRRCAPAVRCATASFCCCFSRKSRATWSCIAPISLTAKCWESTIMVLGD